MSGPLLDEFKLRKVEVDLWFGVLRSQEARATGRRKSNAAEAKFKLLKAGTFLVLYNLTEATVRICVDALWDRIKEQGIPVVDLKPEVRELWVGSRFRQAGDAFSASGKKYRDEAIAILRDVIGSKPAEARFRTLSGGGNLDQFAVLEICRSHCLRFRPPLRSRAGADLATIRDRRVQLAHGLMTFDEVGAGYTTSELEQLKSRTVAYLESFVRQFERHVSREGFKL
ncbi:MAE_28990/MAE_18760 family HEPN-like nuclease [Frateuria sp. GZRe12]|uniref:MAE_28990/MAE_18760 family HEPN-like nuclease n=1 Tax=Frateuria sp. GZRe12 TaxID=3351533 RepID=UPI003EDC616B